MADYAERNDPADDEQECSPNRRGRFAILDAPATPDRRVGTL